MNLSLNEEQVMIREAAQTFLAETCSSEATRAAMAREEGYDPELWRHIAGELGWCAVPIAEEHGGLGLGPVELMLIQEQAGYRLLCAPFFSSVCLGATLLRECANQELQAELGPALAEGSVLLSAPLDSTVDGWTQPQVAAATSDDGSWQLSGHLERVPDAQVAERLLLTARCDDGLGLFELDAGQSGLVVTPLTTWDEGRRFSGVTLDKVTARRCDDGQLPQRLRRAAALARIYIAAEQLGGAQRCLDLTVDYVQERKQFGRPVGSFQAVKHRCAQMMVAVESARSAVQGAAFMAASEPDLVALELESACARSSACEALQFNAAEAIQLHGGVGFTWEYDPQLYFKRAQASAHWLGDPAALRAQLASHLLEEAESAA